MAVVDDNNPKEARPVGIGPGERLQAARIQKGLSLDDVAARMHLSNSILEAIEENNFDEITAPIFVKGYLRAYARIVSLDEDDMIRQYMEYYSEEDPPISSTGNVTPELSVTDARMRWATYLVVIVLAVLLAAWWLNKERDEEPAISLDAQTPATVQDDKTAGEVAESNIRAASENQAEAEETSVAGLQPVAPSADETTMSDNADADSEAPPASVDAEAGSEMVASTEPQQLQAVEPEPEPVPAPELEAEPDPVGFASEEPEPRAAPSVPNTPSLIAPGGSDRMRIVVNADTWADIKDSSGYQLVYDLLRADQSLELIGAAPFSVFLGNGHGVEILVNDEEIDFSSRIRNDNTARLKLGG